MFYVYLKCKFREKGFKLLEYYQKSVGLFFARTGDDGVILDAIAMQYMHCDPQACSIFHWLLEERKSVLEAAYCYLYKYHLVSLQRSIEAIQSFIQPLVKRSLVMRTDDPVVSKVPEIVVNRYHVTEELEVKYLLDIARNVLPQPMCLLTIAHHIEQLSVGNAVVSEDVLQHLASKVINQTCLFHSVVLAWMLRWRGYDVHFEIGVYNRPFSAHAYLISSDGSLLWQQSDYDNSRFVSSLSKIFSSASFAGEGNVNAQ